MAKSRPLGGNWRKRRRPMTGPPGYASSVDYTTTPTPTPTPTPTGVLPYPQILSPQQVIELSTRYRMTPADIAEDYVRDRVQGRTSEVADSPETDRTYEVLKAQNRLLKIMQIAVYEEFIRVQDAIAEAKERAFQQTKGMKKGKDERHKIFLNLMADYDEGYYDTRRVNRSVNAALSKVKENAGVVSLERSDIGRLDNYINRLQAILDGGGIGNRKDARSRDVKVGFPKLVVTDMDGQAVDFRNSADEIIMALWDPSKAQELSDLGWEWKRRGQQQQNNKLTKDGQRLINIGESLKSLSGLSELDPNSRAQTMGWETLGEGDNPYITREALGDQHFYLKPNAIETKTNEFIGISKEGFGSDPTQEIKGQFASDENIESGDFEVGRRIDELVAREPTLDEVARWVQEKPPEGYENWPDEKQKAWQNSEDRKRGIHPNLVTQEHIDAYKKATRPGIVSPQDLIGTRLARFESEEFPLKRGIHALISSVATHAIVGDDTALPKGIEQPYIDPDTGQQKINKVDSIAEINKAQFIDIAPPVRISPSRLAESLQVLNSGFVDALRRQETRERVEAKQFGDRFVKVKRTTHKPTYDPLVVNKVLFDASPEDGKKWLDALRDLIGAHSEDLSEAYKKLGWKKDRDGNRALFHVIRTDIYEQKPKKVQRKDETPATLAATRRAEEERAAQEAESRRRSDLARRTFSGPGGIIPPPSMLGISQAEADRSIDYLAQSPSNVESRPVRDDLPEESRPEPAAVSVETGAVIGPGEAERQQARRDLQLEQYDIDRIATSGWVDALQRPNVRQQMTDLSVQSGFGSDLNALSVDQRKQLIRRFDVGYEGLQSVISSGNPELLKPAHSRGFTQPGKDTGGFVHPDNAKGIVADSMTIFGGSSLSPEQIRRFKEEIPQGDRKRLGINSSPDSIQAYFNAVNADATLILGTKTTLYGDDVTTFTDEAKVANEFGGNVIHNPSPQEFADWLKQGQVRVLNVVGSTQSPYAGPNELQRQLQTLLAEADRNRILNPASGDTLADHAQFWIDLGPNAGVEQLPVQYTGPTRPIKAMGKDGGSNHVLSNLWQIDMDYDPLAGGGLRVEVPTPRGMQMATFPSVEHAYQALKGGGTVTLEQIAPFQTLQQVPKNFASWSPEKQRSWQGQQARRMGGKDVDKSTNLQLMESLLRARFEQDPEFRDALLATDGSRLTHPVKDKFWAENYPALLMGIRDGELGGGRRTLDRDLSHFQARTMRSIQAEGLDPKTASSINRRLDKGETVTYGREVGQPGEILSIEGLKTPVKIIGSKDGRTRIKAATPAEISEYGNAVNTLFPDAYPKMLTQQQKQDIRAQAFIGDAEVLEDVRITPSPDNILAPFALPFSPAISSRMFENRPLGSERPVETGSVRNDIPVDTQGRRGPGYVEVETAGGDVRGLGQPLPSYQEGVQISGLTGPPPRNLPPELYDLHSQYVQTHGRIVADQALSYAYDQRGFGNYNSAEAFKDFINSRAGKRSAIPVDKPRAQQPARPQIRKIISGMQIGGDQLSLQAAQQLGIETGGYGAGASGAVTKDERGRNIEDTASRDKFGIVPVTPELQQQYNQRYGQPGGERGVWLYRTFANVADSDATVFFIGQDTSAGLAATKRFARDLGKPFLVVDIRKPGDLNKLAEFAAQHNVQVLNAAGNRGIKDSAFINKAITQAVRPSIAPPPDRPRVFGFGGGGVVQTDKPVQTVPEPTTQAPPVGAKPLGPQVVDNLPVDQIDAGNAELDTIYAEEEADRPYDPTPQNLKAPPGNNPSTPPGSQKSDPTQDVVPQPVQGVQPGLLKDWDYDAMPADAPKVAPSTLERADRVRDRDMKQAGLDPTKTVDQNAWQKVKQTGTYKFVNSAGKVFTFPAKASWWASKKTITGAIALSKNNPSIAGVTLPDLVEFGPIGIQKYEDAVRPKHKGRDLYLHQLPQHQRSFENISAYLFNNNFIGQEAKSYLDELSNNIKSDVARGLIASPKEHPDFEELRSALNEYAIEPTAHRGRMFTINEQVDEDDLNQFELNLANLQGRSLGGQTNNVLSANAHRGGNVYDIWGWSDLTHQRQSWDDFADGLMSSAELMAQARGLRVARGFVGKGAANLAARAGALKWAGRIGGRAIGWPMVAAEAAIYAEGAADDLASYFHPDYGIPGLREATGVDPITVSHMYTTFQQRPDAKEEYLQFARENPITDENYSVHHNMLLNGIPYSNFHVWEYRDEVDGVKLPQDQIHVVNTWTQETVPISEVERRIPNYGSKWKAEVSRDSIIQGLKLAESVNKERAELGLRPDGRVIISDDMIAEQRQILSEMRDGFTQEELQGFDSLNPIPNVAGFGPIRDDLDFARQAREEFDVNTGYGWLDTALNWTMDQFGNAEDIPRKYLADEELAKRMNNQITLGKGHVDGKGNKIPSASWEESSGRNLATDLWGSAKGTAQLFGAPVEFDKDKYRIIHRDIARDPKSAYDIQQMRNKFNYSPQVQALDKWQEPQLMAPPSPDEQMKKKNKRKNTLSNPFDTGLLGPQDWMNQ